MKKLLSLWLPPILWMGVIFFFSSLPTIKTSRFYWPDFLLKKTAHFVEYFILSLFYFRAFLGSKISFKKSAFLAILISFFYAVSDEYHQSFTPGREPRLRDVVIDTFGASFAIYFINKYSSKLPAFAKKFLGFSHH
jgi:VanZ family protein